MKHIHFDTRTKNWIKSKRSFLKDRLQRTLRQETTGQITTYYNVITY